jgi:penicillin-binding protein 1A
MAKKKKKIGFFARPIVRRTLGAIVLVGSFGLGAIGALFTVVTRDLPTLHSLEDYHPPRTTQVYDAKGELIARLYKERRTVVPVERIPAYVKNAFIAAEDSAFYDHEGLDYLAVVAAILNELKVKVIGGNRRGGSTITQQTAKTFLLTNERTYTRKIKEMVLAMRIEEELTKEEILHLYLNQIYFGHGAYGVEEASKTYYGRSVSDVTLGQAAALASMPKWPNRINPFADHKRLKARRAYVLEQMEKHQLITAEEREKANKEPVVFEVEEPEYYGAAGYYVEHLRRQLVEQFGEQTVNEGGLTIYAAVDAKLQTIADQATKEGLREVDKRQGWRGPLVRLDPDEVKALLDNLESERGERFSAERAPELADAETLDNRPIWDLQRLDAKALRADPEVAFRVIRTRRLKEGLMVGAVVKKVDAVAKKVVVDLGTVDGVITLKSMKWARPYAPRKWTPAPKKPGDVLHVGDVVLVKVAKLNTGRTKGGQKLAPWVDVELEQIPEVQGAFVAIDPHSHRVRAMMGGFDHRLTSFNRATQAFRQPGSSFKPFIYGLAVDKQLFTSVGHLVKEKDPTGEAVVSSRLITDAPKVYFDKWTGKKWNPKNSGGKYRGDITLRTCLTFSVNTCSITLLENVGVEEVHALARKVGLLSDENKFPENLTLALGTGEVRPLDLVNAYSVFPGEGMWAEPILLEKVKDADGNVLFEAEHKPEQVISKGAAYIMADMMKSVVQNGTATGAKALERPVAGKTGTTNMARSVWFLGFSPDLVAGAYVGFDDNSAMGHREYGGKAALPIWLKFMEEASKALPPRDFKIPQDEVVRAAIDNRTGLLAGVDLPPIVDEDEVDPEAADDPAAEQAEVPAETGAEPGEEDPEGEDVLPPSEEGELPPGVYAEVFLKGTEPTATVEDEPPPPLELLEMQGGLGP